MHFFRVVCSNGYTFVVSCIHGCHSKQFVPSCLLIVLLSSSVSFRRSGVTVFVECIHYTGQQERSFMTLFLSQFSTYLSDVHEHKFVLNMFKQRLSYDFPVKITLLLILNVNYTIIGVAEFRTLPCPMSDTLWENTAWRPRCNMTQIKQRDVPSDPTLKTRHCSTRMLRRTVFSSCHVKETHIAPSCCIHGTCCHASFSLWSWISFASNCHKSSVTISNLRPQDSYLALTASNHMRSWPVIEFIEILVTAMCNDSH